MIIIYYYYYPYFIFFSKNINDFLKMSFSINDNDTRISVYLLPKSTDIQVITEKQPLTTDAKFGAVKRGLNIEK